MLEFENGTGEKKMHPSQQSLFFAMGENSDFVLAESLSQELNWFLPNFWLRVPLKIALMDPLMDPYPNAL